MNLIANNKSTVFKKKYNVVSDEKRRTVVQAYNMGQNIREISVNYNIGYYTARNIIRLYKDRRGQGGIFGRRRRALSEDQIKTLWEWVDENCTTKSTELMEKVEARFGIKVTVSTIDRYLKSFHYSIDVLYGDMTLCYPIKPLNLKKSSLVNRHVCDKEKVIFIDATTIKISTRSTANQKTDFYGRNVKRVRAKCYSLFCAFGSNALLYHSLQDFIVSTSPNAFVDDLLNRLNLWGAFSIYFVTSKPIFQNNKYVQKRIANSGHHLVSMPFIDFFHNPMEKLLVEWKLLVQQSRPQTEAELYRNAEMAFRVIPPKINGYYFSNIEKYIAMYA